MLLLQGGSWVAYLLLLHQRLPPGGVFGSKRLHLVLRVLQSWQTATQLTHDWGVTSSSRDQPRSLTSDPGTSLSLPETSMSASAAPAAAASSCAGSEVSIRICTVVCTPQHNTKVPCTGICLYLFAPRSSCMRSVVRPGVCGENATCSLRAFCVLYASPPTHNGHGNAYCGSQARSRLAIQAYSWPL